MTQMLCYSLRGLGNIVERRSEWKDGAREWAGVSWNGVFQTQCSSGSLKLRVAILDL